MKLKNMVPSGRQLRSAKKAFNVAKGQRACWTRSCPSTQRRLDEEQQEGVGEGRRMPIQQSIDVAAAGRDSVEAVEQVRRLPEFMHRIESAEKVDPKHVQFQGKIWGVSRNWEAEITEKRTYEAIAWESEDGLENAGVVTFHKLGPRLTRIELNLDVNPHGFFEKAGRGMRFMKRAARPTCTGSRLTRR